MKYRVQGTTLIHGTGKDVKTYKDGEEVDMAPEQANGNVHLVLLEKGPEKKGNGSPKPKAEK